MECPRPVHPTSEHFSVQRPLFSVKCARDGTGLPYRRRSVPGSGLPSFPMRPEITAEGRKASGEYTRPHNNRTAGAAPLPCAVPHRWSWFRPAGCRSPRDHSVRWFCHARHRAVRGQHEQDCSPHPPSRAIPFTTQVLPTTDRSTTTDRGKLFIWTLRGFMSAGLKNVVPYRGGGSLQRLSVSVDAGWRPNRLARSRQVVQRVCFCCVTKQADFVKGVSRNGMFWVTEKITGCTDGAGPF